MTPTEQCRHCKGEIYYAYLDNWRGWVHLDTRVPRCAGRRRSVAEPFGASS